MKNSGVYMTMDGDGAIYLFNKKPEKLDEYERGGSYAVWGSDHDGIEINKEFAKTLVETLPKWEDEEPMEIMMKGGSDGE